MKNLAIQIIFRSLLEIHRDTIFTYKTMKFGTGFSSYCIQPTNTVYIPVIGKATMHIMKVKFQEETWARGFYHWKFQSAGKIKYLCQAILPCDPAESKV